MSDRAERERQDRLRSQLKGVLGQIEDRAGPPARLHNQAGDLYGQMGDNGSALREYGKAINAYISAGQVGPATALCVKVIRRFPNVVRAHFTVACLALHQGLWVDAVKALDDYVTASLESETQALAIPRLRFLSRGVTDRTVREAIAQHLDDLGDKDEAVAIRTKPPKPLPQGIKRERIFLEAPTWDSDAMWQTYWTSQ